MTDISHIGIAVDDLEQAIKRFTEILGYGPSEQTEVPDHGVKIAFFAGEGSEFGRIELLEAIDDTAPIKKFLDKHGPGLHHIAILVDDLDRKLKELKSKGYRLIDETPRIGAEGKKIAFIHPASVGGILLELQER